MNAEQRYALLIEYAEGTLSAERKAEAERMLEQFPALANDLEALNLAFDSLQVEQTPKVPDQYFSNFTAVLRTKIDGGSRRTFWNVPDVLIRFVRPAAAFSVAAVFILLFRAFDPSTPSSAIYPLMRGAENSEIVSMIEETSTFSDASEIHLLGESISRESFGLDLSNVQDAQEMIALLEEEDAELVVQQLQQRSQKPENL